MKVWTIFNTNSCHKKEILATAIFNQHNKFHKNSNNIYENKMKGKIFTKNFSKLRNSQ